MGKLGPAVRGRLFIQLANFPNHYLVIVITDTQFRYALITTKVLAESVSANMVMEDIAWLDFDRIHGPEITLPYPKTSNPGAEPGQNHYQPSLDSGAAEHSG